jgi:putative Holliday junction resolvase
VRVLAVDHGTVRCGLAISDASGTIARPLDEVEPDAEAIAARAGAEEAEEIVVGLPLTPTGEEGEQAALAIAFASELRELTTLPVVTYDERLTTSQAEASRRSGARASLDAVAAAHLLESYLAARETGRR